MTSTPSVPPSPAIHDDVDLGLLADGAHTRILDTQALTALRDNLECFFDGHGPCPSGCCTSVTYLLEHDFLRPVGAADDGPLTHRFTPAFVQAIAQLEAHGTRFDWNLLQSTIEAHCDPSVDRNSFSVFYQTALYASREITQALAAAQLPGTVPPPVEDTAAGGGNHPISPPGSLPAPHVRPTVIIDDSPVDEELTTPGAADGLSGYHEDPYLPGTTSPHASPFTAAAANDTIVTANYFTKMLLEFSRSQQQVINAIQSKDSMSHNALLAHTTHQILEAHVHSVHKFYGHSEIGKENYVWWRQDFIDRADRLGWDNATRVTQLVGATTHRARKLIMAKRNTTFGLAYQMFIDDFDALLKFMDETFAAAGPMYSFDVRKSSCQKEKETMQDYYERTTNQRRRFWDVFRPYVQSQLTPAVTYLPPRVPARLASELAFDHVMASKVSRFITAASDACPGDGQHASSFRQIITYPAVREAISNVLVEILNEERTAESTSVFEHHILFDHWKFLTWDFLDGCHNQKVKEEAYKERDKRWTKTNIHGVPGSEAVTDFVNHLVKLEDRLTPGTTIFSNNANIGGVGGSPNKDQQMSANKGDRQKQRGGRRGKVHATETVPPADPAPKPPPTPARPPPPPATPRNGNMAPIGGRAPPAAPRGRGRPPGRAPPRNPHSRRLPGETYVGEDGLRRTVGAICDHCGLGGHIGPDCAQLGRSAGAGAVGAVPLFSESIIHPYSSPQQALLPTPSESNLHRLLANPSHFPH